MKYIYIYISVYIQIYRYIDTQNSLDNFPDFCSFFSFSEREKEQLMLFFCFGHFLQFYRLVSGNLNIQLKTICNLPTIGEFLSCSSEKFCIVSHGFCFQPFVFSLKNKVVEGQRSQRVRVSPANRSAGVGRRPGSSAVADGPLQQHGQGGL